MKFLQDNNKALEVLMTRIAEELKRVVKFSNHKLAQQEILDLCITHLKAIAAQPSVNKENINPNIPLSSHNNRVGRENEYSVKQCGMDWERSRKMFIQLQKQKVQFSSPFHQKHHSSTVIHSQRYNNLDREQIELENVPMTKSVTKGQVYSDLNNLPQPLTMKNSSISTNNNSKMFTSEALRLSSSKNATIEKSRTYSKLRKLEEVFFVQSPRTDLRRKNSLATDCWRGRQDDHKYLIEENNNLKAIQSNLKTHLKLLEQYRSVPSLEMLIEKQEKLRKKEVRLRQIQHELHLRQLKLTKQVSTLFKEHRID